MGDVAVPASEIETEEKTEPFSSSEYASRLHGIRVQESFVANEAASNVHLDELVVPPDKDIRLLVRPLRSRSVSPGTHDNCEWVALRAEVSRPDQPQETVLAVTQTAKDIKFTVLVPGEHHSDGTPIPPLWCELYYDPTSDNQILLNNCDVPITLSRVFSSSPPPSADGTPVTPGTPNGAGIEYTINPGTVKALSPGTWRIQIGAIEVLDFRILEKRRTLAKAVFPSPRSDKESVIDTLNSSAKRSFDADEDDAVGPDTRRQKTLGAGASDGKDKAGDEDKEAVIMFLRPTADPLVFPLPTSTTGKEIGSLSSAHALLDMKKTETVEISGGCEMDSYKLTRRDPIASTSLSTVFTGTTDHPNVPPGSVITVKIIKTRPAPTSVPNGAVSHLRPQELERITVRQADTWLREYQSHEYLRHDSIVRLYGGDARYLSLYMEHVDANDLSTKGVWRASNSDYFTGDRLDATRILRDITGALQYIHSRNLVHNDVKPANILYSRDRGAVLCDFGLSTHTESPPSAGGTPYYVPPEFIGRRFRGPPSDVWALGVTMLYVVRKICFPESRGRHRARPLYWMIADVNKAPTLAHAPPGTGRSGNAQPTPSAASQMQMWLSEVHDAREKLNREDRIERLTYEMLVPNRNQRITMKRVVNELFTESSA
ncbi:serine/threonine-protein kinase [Niveomyces insectorum RCEF 264]|uniref:Serine/threonine-protein kinase n=1 Tax=Niveomyces insectorum RCEF 264 TaxID=1081102 RepID=A0A167N8I6_9HYPO|nr:serine/threonine-protein kinase [Niveomyces insectorum RCEF 264]